MLEARHPSASSGLDALREARWVAIRRPERTCDNALTGTARLWLRRLPARRRPLSLCMQYPRVANRIAWCWHDAALSAQLLQDLMDDRRGGRRGFGAAIQRELLRLRDFNDQHRVEFAPHNLWQALTRGVGLG